MLKWILFLYIILCVFVTLVVTLKASKSSGKIITMISLINFMYIVDVCIPALAIILDGKREIAYYMGKIEIESYYLAVFVHSIAIFLFWFFYLQNKKKKKTTNNVNVSEIQIKKVESLIWIFMVIYVLSILNDINSIGGLEQYYNYKIVRAYAVRISYPNTYRRIFALISQSLLTPQMILSALYIIKGKNRVKKIFYFFVTFLFVLLTLYRGTLLNYFFMILILYEDIGCKLQFNKKVQRILGIGIVAAIAFLGYGGVRLILTKQYWGSAENGFGFIQSVIEMTRKTLGNTLVGTARCIQFLHEGGELFFGLSIWELLYRFIPRAIWKSKPALYGMQTISMYLGTPESTMDSLSLLGELIINFGFFAFFLIPFYGKLAYKFEQFREKKQLFLLYAAMLFPLCTTVMWMGNTGLVSHMLSMVFYYMVLKYIFSKKFLYFKKRFFMIIR